MKKFSKLLFSMLLFFLCSLAVKANSIDKITMDIYIDSNGNANITEVWKANLNKGTEGYHPYYNLNNSNITMTSVTDDTGYSYTLNDSWNINDSFSEKKYTYGIYKSGEETDLCWGISKYGSRTYTIKYTINNFIYNTSDGYQILYWQLIPYNLSSKPDTAYIKVYADNKFSDSLDVWGYGNYGGTCYVYDGYIEMQSNGQLDSDEYMTMLVKFPNNTFNTTNKIDKTFDDIYSEADEGTTHYNKDDDKESWLDTLIGIILTFFPIILITIIMIYCSKASIGSNKLINKIMPHKVAPFRDLPCKSDISCAYLISREYFLGKNQNDYLGAVLLKWIKDGNVLVSTEESKILKKKSAVITFINEPTDALELEMYEMMRSAAKDNVLENNEFKAYCTNHYSKVLGWFDKVIDDKITDLKQTGLVVATEKKILGFTSKKNGATDKLNEMARELAGLKLFFKEFTSMNEKEPIEVKLWREYLMYAQILGMADKVAAEFKKLYPDVITDDTFETWYLVNTFSSTSVNAASVARSRAESYSSGGGGFSSGGGGGGSFGGGGGGGGFR
jgi:hypothetical protein